MFGTWQFGMDGLAHYYAAAVPLCGKSAATTSLVPDRQRHGKGKPCGPAVTTHHCLECLDENSRRWHGVGLKEAGMLVLDRKEGERVVIGDDIVIEVIDARRGHVRLGITCPRQIPVDREEIRAQKQARDKH